MDEQYTQSDKRTLIVDLVGGPFDGAELIAIDVGQQPRLEQWNESDKTIAVFRDTNDGEIGGQFSMHCDLTCQPICTYPHYQLVSTKSDRWIMGLEYQRFKRHVYAITERLVDADGVLVRAVYASKLDASTIITGRLASRCS